MSLKHFISPNVLIGLGKGRDVGLTPSNHLVFIENQKNREIRRWWASWEEFTTEDLDDLIQNLERLRPHLFERKK